MVPRLHMVLNRDNEVRTLRMHPMQLAESSDTYGLYIKTNYNTYSTKECSRDFKIQVEQNFE